MCKLYFLHSPSVSEDDIPVPDLLPGGDGYLSAGESDAVHEFVDALRKFFLRLLVAYTGKADRVDPEMVVSFKRWF